MVKAKRRYVCQSCGSLATRWQGQCADCLAWNTLAEDASAGIDIPVAGLYQARTKEEGIALGIRYLSVAEVQAAWGAV